MTEREHAINRDLHALDEAHRLNRISRSEYRLRRRRVFQFVHDNGGVVTARKSLGSSVSTTPPRSGSARADHANRPSDDGEQALASLMSGPTIAWKHWLGFLSVVIVVVALAAWLLLSDG